MVRRLMILALLAGSVATIPAAHATPPAYQQDWEAGISGWTGSNSPVLLANDPSAPSPTVQLITSLAEGGEFFSPEITLAAGNYCLSSWIRWDGGHWPFVGIDIAGAGERWIIGRAEYPGVSAAVSEYANGWVLYSGPFTLESTSLVKIKDELWFQESKPGEDRGSFDDLRITPGSCFLGGGRAAGVRIDSTDSGLADTGEWTTNVPGRVDASEAVVDPLATEGMRSWVQTTYQETAAVAQIAKFRLTPPGRYTIEGTGVEARAHASCTGGSTDVAIGSLRINGQEVTEPIRGPQTFPLPDGGWISIGEQSSRTGSAEAYAIHVKGPNYEFAVGLAIAFHGPFNC